MIGSRLGNWVIEKEIGRGGMGSVFLGREQTDGQSVREPRLAAVKILAPSLAQEPGFVYRFQREIEALSKLRHPNIVQFFEAGVHRDCHYYVMEYVRGPTFDDLLEKRTRLPWHEVMEAGIQICAALKHAHDHGIIHRDIKPSNLLLNHDGTIKLLDFGIAKLFADRSVTATNAVVGTAEYLSPEQAAGKPVTRRSDLYSLGVVLYTLATGRPLFEAENMLEMLQKHRFARFDPPRKYVPELPHDLDVLICQLLEKEPGNRPPDAQVVGKQLERLRRQTARKNQLTTDEVRSRSTLVATGVSSTEKGAREPGEATLMSQLMRAELESMKQGGPINRILNRAWVLLILLGAILAVLAWGLWPRSVEQRLDDIEKLAQQGGWADASEKLRQIDDKFPDRTPSEREKELRIRVSEGLAQSRLNRAGQDPAPWKEPPSSAAERFYREGLQDYQEGNLERAKIKWQRLIAAFSGTASQKEWVLLAEQALKKATAPEPDLRGVEEAIRLARTEEKAQAIARLQALLQLYADRQDGAGKSARARVEAALNEIGER